MLSKAIWLTSNYEFNKTRRFGKSYSGKYSRMFLLRNENPSEPARVGIVVTKKFAKTAVERNRIKRMYREIFRKLLKNTKSGYWIVVYPRNDFAEASYEEINSDIAEILQKISVLG